MWPMCLHLTLHLTRNMHLTESRQEAVLRLTDRLNECLNRAGVPLGPMHHWTMYDGAGLLRLLESNDGPEKPTTHTNANT